MTNQTITISISEYNELLGIKDKYEYLARFRKTDRTAVTKNSDEDYKRVIEEQGKALYKLNQRIREKTREITRLNHEMAHSRRTGGRLTITKSKGKITKLPIKEMYDFKNIVILALRYSLGRKNYVTTETSNFIKDHPEVVDKRTKMVMLKDLNNYFDKREVFYRDDKCDYETWLDLKNWLENIEV